MKKVNLSNECFSDIIEKWKFAAKISPFQNLVKLASQETPKSITFIDDEHGVIDNYKYKPWHDAVIAKNVNNAIIKDDVTLPEVISNSARDIYNISKTQPIDEEFEIKAELSGDYDVDLLKSAKLIKGGQAIPLRQGDTLAYLSARVDNIRSVSEKNFLLTTAYRQLSLVDAYERLLKQPKFPIRQVLETEDSLKSYRLNLKSVINKIIKTNPDRDIHIKSSW